MTFWDHMDELRGRIVQCLYVFFAGFVGAYFLSDHLLDWLREPLFRHLPEGKRHLYYTGLFENFFVHLRVSGYASLLFLSPVYFFILWRFISPGLREREKRNALPFAIAASLFFLVGAAFAYLVLFPAGIKYFLSYGTPAEVAWLTLESYISLVLKILFGFGLAFELPVLLVLFAKLGFVTPSSMRAHRRTALILITIVSAFIAPPDAVSMLLLMAPLYVLYEAAIVVVQKIYGPDKS